MELIKNNVWAYLFILRFIIEFMRYPYVYDGGVYAL